MFSAAAKSNSSNNKRDHLYWVPGHMGVNAKEAIDKLKRNAAETPFCGPEPFCGLGILKLFATNC